MTRDKEIRRAVDSMVILVDTREQDTERLPQRLETLGHEYRRETLESADYWVEYRLADDSTARLPVAIERKMSLDELAKCFTSERDRFQDEMERLSKDGIHTYLLIEDGCWEDIYRGKYRSKMYPGAFMGSLLWWMTHYKLNIIFCKHGTSGRLIGDILKYEVSEDARRRLNDDSH